MEPNAETIPADLLVEVFTSRYMPCPDCGASLDRSERLEHACDLERWLDYQLFALREHTARLEAQVHDYFRSPEGRFEAWYAARMRRLGA